MKNPLVSILIPTYNQPEFFRQAFESAINQDYPNIEIIVSDDSTDDRVKNVFDEYKNCGRKIQYLKHGGYTNESTGERSLANMENLLKHANGEFINILFHDDLIHPQKISKMMKFFTGKNRDQIAIVSSARNIIDSDGNILKTEDFIEQFNLYNGKDSILLTGEEVGRMILLLCGNFIGELSTVLIRRKDFYRACVNKLSPGYFIGVKDRTMWDISTYLEICKDGRGLMFLHEPLNAFRMAGGNQNTYNGNVRLSVVIDWLEFVVAAYLNGIYIHDKKDFEIACEYWLFIAQGMISFFQRFPETSVDIEIDLLEQIMQAVESVEQKNFDSTLEIGTQWIQKFSYKTFEMRKTI
ncbi:MAG: glycosyltransferase [Selenomonadaceae bacterium]|nr:glycosyltransferase [Selenomonadaceae bacterium]